jgi:hypothetical protein
LTTNVRLPFGTKTVHRPDAWNQHLDRSRRSAFLRSRPSFGDVSERPERGTLTRSRRPSMFQSPLCLCVDQLNRNPDGRSSFASFRILSTKTAAREISSRSAQHSRSSARCPGEEDAASPVGHHILDRGDVWLSPLAESRCGCLDLIQDRVHIGSLKFLCEFGRRRRSASNGRGYLKDAAAGFCPAQKAGDSTDRSQHPQYQRRPLRQRPTVPSQSPGRTSFQ